MKQEDKEEFKRLSNDLIKFLCEKGHPCMTAVITPVSAELLEGIVGVQTFEHVKD